MILVCHAFDIHFETTNFPFKNVIMVTIKEYFTLHINSVFLVITIQSFCPN